MTDTAPFQPGDRIVTLQVPWRGLTGTIIEQYRQSDDCEMFWGNCVAKMDNGTLSVWNCWQLDREDGWCERAVTKQAVEAAKLEAKERAELARLNAKYHREPTVCP